MDVSYIKEFLFKKTFIFTFPIGVSNEKDNIKKVIIPFKVLIRIVFI